MPQPTQSQMHVDVPLTNISVAYMNDEAGFVFDKVFPVVPVTKESDKYYIYTKNDWFRDEAQRRGRAAPSAGSGYGLSVANYSCDEWAIHKMVPWQDMSNADAALDPEGDAARFVTQRLMLRREMQFASDFMTTSVWATDSTPSNLWSDYAASDPITDIETGQDAIYDVTGLEANTLLLSRPVFRKLRRHPSLLEVGKQTQALSESDLAAVLGVERVIVAKALKATNVEGETAAYDKVFGKHALLLHVAKAPSLYTPSAGYVFSYRNQANPTGADISIERIENRDLKATKIEGMVSFDCKAVATDLGYFFNGAVA